MYDSDFEKALQDHVEAFENNHHTNQLLNLWKFLYDRIGLPFDKFERLTEEARDELFVSTLAAENLDE